MSMAAVTHDRATLRFQARREAGLNTYRNANRKRPEYQVAAPEAQVWGKVQL
ncbi:hypothetical protein G6011_00776 [Alternaria panax]|uniref:Uncharacterized protein n=1 Tax=Alternaria panax TaxID=48097 RepID=A0AAD4NW08_9PLEO|nr:hypothetical protein G6011_00776 [Alternaria panax]